MSVLVATFRSSPNLICALRAVAGLENLEYEILQG